MPKFRGEPGEPFNAWLREREEWELLAATKQQYTTPLEQLKALRTLTWCKQETLHFRSVSLAILLHPSLQRWNKGRAQALSLL